MSHHNRSFLRNLHIYSVAEPYTVLGGLSVANGMTNANFYSMVEIAYIIDQDYVLCYENGTTVQRDDNPLQPGKYMIDTPGPLMVNDEPWLVRASFRLPETSNTEFRDAVRKRDCRCVVTGQRTLYAEYGDQDWVWFAYDAVHIFPLAHEQYWIDHAYDGWVTIPGSAGSIDSVQNGVLLESSIRDLFQSYIVSINPDDNYKIVCFLPDNLCISGTHYDKTLLEDPQRPSDQLLRWHFRQAVLANMRGEGEPFFEAQFPYGDSMGEVMRGPKPGERMEFELFSRLAEFAKAS